MPYEIFLRKRARETQGVFVNLSTKRLLISKEAGDAFLPGLPAVEIMWDPEARSVRLRPSSKHRHAYTIHTSKTGMRSIAFTLFCDHIKLPPGSKFGRMEATLTEDGCLEFTIPEEAWHVQKA